MGLNGKLKRKDIDIVNDDFSDFSLYSPATKIRRLGADLPPIIEEDESLPENQERAIVLFSPLPLHDNSNSNILLRSPSTLSISLNPELISGFKSQFLRANDMETGVFDEDKTEVSKNLAVVPWVPFQIPSVESRDGDVEVSEEPMEVTDEMDVEENNGGLNATSEAVHHWPHPTQQQQHCLMPQPPVNPFTPITWCLNNKNF